MRYAIIFFLLLSCSLVEESKVHYFKNQLTPTINASLTLFAAYLKCRQSIHPDNPTRPTGAIFIVKGKQDHFYLTNITSLAGELSVCEQAATFSTKEIPYQNKLTRWYNKEKEIFTYDMDHGKLYNFNQIYLDTTYRFEITFITENEFEIFIKRTDDNHFMHTQENQEKRASFYEQHSFKGTLKSNTPNQVFYTPPGNHNIEFSW